MPKLVHELFTREFLTVCGDNHHLDWEDEEWKNIEVGYTDLISAEKYGQFVDLVKKNYSATMGYDDYEQYWNEAAVEIQTVDILQVINDRINVLLGRDNLIGHSYFIRVYSWDNLKEAIYHNILPLLQEYFFGDYGKIGLVLGSGFVKEIRNDTTKKVKFADFKYEEVDTLQKVIYEIIPESELDKDKFKAAIKKLLNSPTTTRSDEEE